MASHGGIRHGVSRLTDHDIYLFREGRHFRLYEKLGAHVMDVDGEEGVLFAVWAPNARTVSVVGDFNGWNPETHCLASRSDSSGIWEGFVPGVGEGALYKFHIRSNVGGYEVAKADPFAFFGEAPANTASIVRGLDYGWSDGDWMRDRWRVNAAQAPMSVYEAHLGSWRRDENGYSLNYTELARDLPGYVRDLGFTHVEFLPVMEHPFFGSWGYQTTGYFSPSSRQGTPQQFMDLVNALHREGVGVILDWVPSHFPGDQHGLHFFDGTHLYEHEDPRTGFHPEWNSWIFNFGRYEVRSFLVSSALFWLDRYHVDGLRVDAVASMLYLDYSREDGQWVPNEYGGKENIDAIEFLRTLNVNVYREYPDVQTIAEESTAWPMVSRPAYLGGLGFGMKWNMGWMHDTLEYFTLDPVYRKFHHDKLTFNLWYAFTENFMLPLSHDEVVYGKGSLYGKMPGDDWQKRANLRLLYGYMFAMPGKKLLFMGAEIGQHGEWSHDGQVQWDLLESEGGRGLYRFLRDLNRVMRSEPGMYERDFEDGGFEWVDFHDSDSSIISFLRKDAHGGGAVLAVFNFTPVPRENYEVGVPEPGHWHELLNSDSEWYGGSGWGNYGGLDTRPVVSHGRPQSLCLHIPPLGMVLFRHED
ncbi:1,4-alpha-glucan branching enzyme [Desulfobaculum xiamenense]|uniref:1,4-alpha-glucan branching enzyme GlgB n=1 Tax=Desulfobaculum xiamenense TaxID=995050 RepID=A0A846QP71_9BACT|nr:1,4-alpha-glucan branching protein GlgB [Desulfobaculum xiamenense]NJB68967.1 1,4-alpha-glucan branching enzyme [Desulfobaculum xiamenense]